MSRLSQWMAGPIACAAAFLFCTSAASAEQALTGPMRTAFVESSMRGCLNKALENRNAPATLVSQSCKCFAEGLADRTSNDELLSLAKLSPETRFDAMRPKMDALRQSCLDHIRKQ